MSPTSAMVEDKPCQICCSARSTILMAQCSRCKTSQHVFGMTTLLKQVPERWVCHECSLQQNNSSQPSENGTMQHQFGRQKAVRTSKVKFISPEEAAQQISGSWKSQPTISVSTSRRPLALSDRAALPMLSGHLNPPVPGAKKPSPIPEQQSQTAKHLKGEPSCSAQSKKAASKDPAVADRKGELSKSSSQRARRKHEPSRLEDDKAISRSGDNSCVDEPKKSQVQYVGLPDFLIRMEKCLLNHPALNATWHGDIEIVGEVSCNNVYGGLQAHPPTKTHRKAWELSRQMPRALQFAAIPRAAIWTKRGMFQDRRPSGLDISLYIFPSDFERSKFQYRCLLEFVEEEDFVLGCCINGVELFVSTSKLLNADSWDSTGESFLWGVFHGAGTS